MFNFLMFIIILSCLWAQVLVTQNKRNGYLIWTIADGFLAMINFLQYPNSLAVSQGFLWSAYFIVSFWGWLKWSKHEKTQ